MQDKEQMPPTNLANKVNKIRGMLKLVRNDELLSSDQKAMVHKLKTEIETINSGVNTLAQHTDATIELVKKMEASSCFSYFKRTNNTDIQLSAKLTGKNLEIATIEFAKIYDIESRPSTIAKDIGISRQALNTMKNRGYATPQSAARFALVPKYAAINKHKLRPDVTAEQWGLLLVEGE